MTLLVRRLCKIWLGHFFRFSVLGLPSLFVVLPFSDPSKSSSIPLFSGRASKTTVGTNLPFSASFQVVSAPPDFN